VSPDGTKVSFGMNNHIWVINMDGTGLKQVTTSNGLEVNPSWSPDGNWIGSISDASSAYSGGNGYALVPANATTPDTLTAAALVWVQDKNSSVGIIQPTGNVSWK
jgi:TolB protein